MIPFETTLLCLVIISGFYMAWNIGANDVANAMGTSVGSGALTLRQAILIAAVLEFAGAFFFGAHVSETMQSGLVDAHLFAQDPISLVYGMLSSLLAAGVWLQIASYYGWPVSTTHTIVGAIVGFGVVVGGLEAIYWENVAFVVSSWILSPLFGAMLGFLIFNTLRKNIFYAPDPVTAAKKLTPSLVFLVTSILSLVMLYKGLNNLHIDFNFLQAAGVSALIGSLGFFLSRFLINRMPLLHTSSTEHDQLAFVENIFGHLQIMSACLMAFAHGANDVANAIGPLTAAVMILKTASFLSLGRPDLGFSFGRSRHRFRTRHLGMARDSDHRQKNHRTDPDPRLFS